MKNNFAILVLSCDKYQGLWQLFFNRLFKYWKDCNLKIYLSSNYIKYNDSRVTTISIGIDNDWSTNLVGIIDEIQEDNLLLFMEDAPLDAYVDINTFNDLCRIFSQENMNYLNLKSSPASSIYFNEYCNTQPKGALYRTAIVPCLWSKKILKELLVKGENAWMFEINGSIRSDKYSNFFVVNKPFFKILHLVIRGKLDRRSYNQLLKNNEEVPISFPVMTFYEQMHIYLQELRSRIFLIIPIKYRRSIRIFFKK